MTRENGESGRGAAWSEMRSKDPKGDGALPPKARRLVEAIVDAAIARGDGAPADRKRLLQEAMEEFRQVSHLQGEAAKLIRKQRRRLADQSGRIIALEEQLRDMKKVLDRRERRLKNARETILNYDGEIERLTAQTRADAELIEEMQAALRAREGRHVRTRGSGAARTGLGGPTSQADGADTAPPPPPAAG